MRRFFGEEAEVVGVEWRLFEADKDAIGVISTVSTVRVSISVSSLRQSRVPVRSEAAPASSLASTGGVEKGV